MKAARRKHAEKRSELICSVLTRREAAGLIGSGAKHVHSSQLKDRDACARVTAEILKTGIITPYSWEVQDPSQVLHLHSSQGRHDLITQLVNHPLLATRRKTQEKIKMILEEMLTNSLYHAYQLPGGEEKYPRKLPVRLEEKEIVQVAFSPSAEGVFLSVRDQGGSFDFPVISGLFQRCYGNAQDQIEEKMGGAGLGMYMIFEAVTHLKIVCEPSKHTAISIWISEGRQIGQENFSFNYFKTKGHKRAE